MSDTKTRGSSGGHKGQVREKHRREDKSKIQELTDTINSYQQQAKDMLNDRNRALLAEDTAKKELKDALTSIDYHSECLEKMQAQVNTLRRNRKWWVVLGGVTVGAGAAVELYFAVWPMILDAWNYWT